MRKQTKLVAVLSAAALLAIGASMTSFAATGWAEENGTWVFYDRDESRATDEWKRSGNNWFYLDSDGNMAVDSMIEDDDDIFYVGADGAMITNQWVAMENEDAGDDDEPETNWYYFQNNGKAYKAGTSNNAYFRTINGKKYVFNDDGEMQFGWVDETGERLTGDDAWSEAVYYCGDENDGAQSIGWKYIHILDENWDPDSQVNGELFDEEQDRWFYFRSNGKRYADEEKTINGRKYNFDENGRMVAEWWIDTDKASMSNVVGSPAFTTVVSSGRYDGTTTLSDQGNPNYTNAWKYYGSPEDGARVTRGWFQVVPSEWLDSGDYNDSDENWYYSDNDGNLVANEFKTINGKKYAFDSFGRMLSGLKVVETAATSRNTIVAVWDTDAYDDEEKFEEFSNTVAGDYVYTGTGLATEAASYYFGDASDGAMKTGKVNVTLDGESLSFLFTKSGSRKGRGATGIEDSKYYLGGKLFKADRDEKYEFIIEFAEAGTTNTQAIKVNGDDLMNEAGIARSGRESANGRKYVYFDAAAQNTTLVALLNQNMDLRAGLSVNRVLTVNTSGSIVRTKSKTKTGNDMIFDVNQNVIREIYEDIN